MKNFQYILLLSSMIFVGCETDKLPFPEPEAIDKAPYVAWEITSPVIDFTDLENSFYGGPMTVPADNVASHSLSVSRVSGGTVSDTVFLKTITEFPQDVRIMGAELAQALGISSEDFQPGDQINIIGESVGTSGVELTLNNLTATVLSGDGALGALNQAYSLTTFFSCPFEQDKIVGTYDVVTHAFDAFFGTQPPTREVVAGPGPNQYTIIGGAIPLDGADDLIVTVNPNTGQVSYGGSASAIHFNTFGPGVYGTLSGFTFSCVGFINLTIISPGFIPNTLTLQKQ